MNTYKQQIQIFSKERQQLVRKRSIIGWSRLACMVLAALFIFWQWPLQSGWQLLPSIVLLAVFLRLVVWSINISQAIQHLEQLIIINQDEIAIAHGRFNTRYDGWEFMPSNHHYAHDLDLLGRASLYQYVQRAESFVGRQLLAQWLLQPAPADELLLRQEAAQVLAPELQWRQHLQASGRLHPVGGKTKDRLDAWIATTTDEFSSASWGIIRWVGPAISLSFFAAYVFDFITLSTFNLYLLVFFLITSYISKKATPTYNALSKMADEINTLSNALQYIEQMPLGSAAWLRQQHAKLVDAEGNKASKAIASLNGILKRLDYRLNPLVFLPLNILLFWDLQQMLAFRNWKGQHAEAAKKWMQVLGETEAMASIAALAYNEPQWCFPQWETAHGCFEAAELGHPLIKKDKRVVSDFTTKGNAQVSVITGSNMAGKSTFLRSVGLALVMGQAGAPVCASHARFSAMLVMSSMRIADNLEESTSTFYAELKKLKSIIDAVNGKQPVFLLLDEILRGTNSGDRHIGSEALIRQLIKQQAVGLIATHDLALASMEQQLQGHIHNYHFDVQVEGEELYFDYQLKQGICKSLNASILMKKIGIEI